MGRGRGLLRLNHIDSLRFLVQKVLQGPLRLLGGPNPSWPGLLFFLPSPCSSIVMEGSPLNQPLPRNQTSVVIPLRLLVGMRPLCHLLWSLPRRRRSTSESETTSPLFHPSRCIFYFYVLTPTSYVLCSVNFGPASLCRITGRLSPPTYYAIIAKVRGTSHRVIYQPSRSTNLRTCDS